MRLKNSVMSGALVVAVVYVAFASAQTNMPAITLDRTVHFTAQDGSDVEAAPGTYRVEPGHEGRIRLSHESGLSAEIQATRILHEENVTALMVMAVMEEGQDDQVHLVLVLPGGQARDAVGSYSGVALRGFAPPQSVLKAAQVQAAINQTKTAPQQPAPAPAPSPAVVRVPAASVGTAGAAVKMPSGVNLGAGKWISWTYLQVNHPEVVAQAIADVQAGKRPLTSLAGLATPTELNEMLKTNWAAEVARLNAAKQATVTTRGLPAAVTASPDTMARTLLPLPVQDLGATYSGEHHTRTFSVTASADGYLTAELDIKDVTEKRFRIDHAVAYTGEFVNGVAQIYREAFGGDFLDIRSKTTSDPTKVSMAGYVILDVKAGQRVLVTVAFEPHASIGPKVGAYETTLQLNWHRPDTTIAYQTVPLRAYCNGISFGLIAYAEQGSAITLTNKTVDFPLVVTNASANPVTATVSAQQLPPDVIFNGPTSVSLPGKSTQRYNLRFTVYSNAQDGSNQPIAIALNESGHAHTVNLALSIYHPMIYWCASLVDECRGETAGSLKLGQTVTGLGDDVGVDQVQLWIKDNGTWWWKINTFNNHLIDIGGADFRVRLWFEMNGPADEIDVHIGAKTSDQQYERVHVDPWIQKYYLQAAEAGAYVTIW